MGYKCKYFVLSCQKIWMFQRRNFSAEEFFSGRIFQRRNFSMEDFFCGGFIQWRIFSVSVKDPSAEDLSVVDISWIDPGKVLETCRCVQNKFLRRMLLLKIFTKGLDNVLFQFMFSQLHWCILGILQVYQLQAWKKKKRRH